MRVLKSFPHRADWQRKFWLWEVLGGEVPIPETKMAPTTSFHSSQREKQQKWTKAIQLHFLVSCCSFWIHAFYLAFSHNIIKQVLPQVATKPSNIIYNGCIVFFTQIHYNSCNYCPLVGHFGCFHFFPSLEKYIVMKSQCIKFSVFKIILIGEILI